MTRETKAGREDQARTPPSKRRLKTAQDLRQFLADVLNRLNRSELDPMNAKAMAYIGQVLGGLIEKSDLETRLAALEAAQGEGNAKRKW